MNPYEHLLDSFEDLEGREHTAECNADCGIPWHSTPPRPRSTGFTLHREQMLRRQAEETAE